MREQLVRRIRYAMFAKGFRQASENFWNRAAEYSDRELNQLAIKWEVQNERS